MYAALRFSETTIFGSACRFFAASLLFAGAAHAADLPPELMNNGAPIDALCFESVSTDEWLDINNCSKGEVVKVPSTLGAWADDKIGYSYRYKEDSSDAVSYSYYQYIGTQDGSPVVLSYSSGGGTGQFSSLVSIERNASKIRVRQGFAAGDRCNGGITGAKISTFGNLSYDQNMTPIDFLQLAEDNPNDVQPYEDLEASASSCYGIAHFSGGNFEGITLQELPKLEEGGIQYKYQDCFNKLFIAEWAQGNKEMSVEELKKFTGLFNETCVVAE